MQVTVEVNDEGLTDEQKERLREDCERLLPLAASGLAHVILIEAHRGERSKDNRTP